MDDPLMIGTRGWEHAAWVGGFYPPELPEEWRFCFYSNNLRSVLVPQAAWADATRANAEQWVTDSDPAFRFVLELPAALSTPLGPAQRDQLIEAFLESTEPIAPRTAGLLLRIAPDTPLSLDWFEHLLNRLGDIAPTCVDLAENEWRGPEPLGSLMRQGTGLAWHCGHEPAPRPGGRLLVALAPPASAREVRGWIERLAQWRTGGTAAGLFFDAPEAAAKSAQEARIIAELMGV
jgi:uncharacterized protein YecE (DUF72 family)